MNLPAQLSGTEKSVRQMRHGRATVAPVSSLDLVARALLFYASVNVERSLEMRLCKQIVAEFVAVLSLFATLIVAGLA